MFDFFIYLSLTDVFIFPLVSSKFSTWRNGAYSCRTRAVNSARSGCFARNCWNGTVCQLVQRCGVGDSTTTVKEDVLQDGHQRRRSSLKRSRQSGCGICSGHAPAPVPIKNISTKLNTSQSSKSSTSAAISAGSGKQTWFYSTNRTSS